MQPVETARKKKPRKPSSDELRQLFERTGVDPTVDTNEAAALLGNEPQTLRRWNCEGSGPIRPRKVNGRLRWSVTEIQAILSPR